MASISARRVLDLEKKLAATQDHRDRALELLREALQWDVAMPAEWARRAELAISAVS